MSYKQNILNYKQSYKPVPEENPVVYIGKFTAINRMKALTILTSISKRATERKEAAEDSENTEEKKTDFDKDYMEKDQKEVCDFLRCCLYIKKDDGAYERAFAEGDKDVYEIEGTFADQLFEEALSWNGIGSEEEKAAIKNSDSNPN